VGHPCKVYIDLNLHDTLDMGDGLIVVSKHSDGTLLRCYVNYHDDVYYFVVKAC
jgi:hypothetical protein